MHKLSLFYDRLGELTFFVTREAADSVYSELARKLDSPDRVTFVDFSRQDIPARVTVSTEGLKVCRLQAPR